MIGKTGSRSAELSIFGPKPGRFSPLLTSCSPMSKRKVAYFYDSKFFFFFLLSSYRNMCAAEIGAYSYGLGHPMKPQRMRITHELVTAYDMLDKMHIIVSAQGSYDEL